MYNESIKKSIYKYREKNREKINEYQCILMREKYNDEEFKKVGGEKNKIRLYNKYHNDPEYKKKQQDRARERYRQKKLINLEKIEILVV